MHFRANFLQQNLASWGCSILDDSSFVQDFDKRSTFEISNVKTLSKKFDFWRTTINRRFWDWIWRKINDENTHFWANLEGNFRFLNKYSILKIYMSIFRPIFRFLTKISNFRKIISISGLPNWLRRMKIIR